MSSKRNHRKRRRSEVESDDDDDDVEQSSSSSRSSSESSARRRPRARKRAAKNNKEEDDLLKDPLKLVKDKAERRRIDQLPEWEKEQELATLVEKEIQERQRKLLLAEKDGVGVVDGGSRRRGRPGERKSEDGGKNRRGATRERRTEEAIGKLRAERQRQQARRKGDFISAMPKNSGIDENSDSGSSVAFRGTNARSDVVQAAGERAKLDRSSRRKAAADKDNQSDEMEIDNDEMASSSNAPSLSLKGLQHNPQVPLFTEGDLVDDSPISASRKSDRQIEKTIETDLSLEAIEALRLNIDNLTHMVEHPKAESFINGCYVKLPAKLETSSTRLPVSTFPTPLVTPYFMGRIIDFETIPVDTDKTGGNLMIQLRVKGRTLKTNAPSEVWPVSAVVNEPFSTIELENYRHYLRSVDPKCIESLPKEHIRKARMLREFTFTDDDVEVILKKKRQRMSEGGVGVVTNSKHLFFKKADLEVHIEQMKAGLQSETLSAGARQSKTKKLRQAEADLQAIQQQISECRSLQRKQESETAVGSGRGGIFKLGGASNIGRRSLGNKLFGGNSGSVNPYARRECRPSVMWATGVSGKSQPGAVCASKDDTALPANSTTTPLLAETPNSRSLLSISRDQQLRTLREFITVHREVDIIAAWGFNPYDLPPRRSLPPLLGRTPPLQETKGRTLSLSEYLHETRKNAEVA